MSEAAGGSAGGEAAGTERAWLVAQVVERFELTGVQAAGEFGQKLVFPALRAGDEVMVKVAHLPRDWFREPLERARREVALLRRISHPNVVQLVEDLVEFSRDGDRPVGVAWLEERLDGDDLEGRFGALWPIEEVIELGLAVSRGLAEMHRAGVVHRDLSPANVFACSDRYRRYVVLDPGWGRHLERSPLTGQGFIAGTRGYLSPEHGSHRSQPVPASDVFSTGILLHLALTGKLPFSLFTGYEVSLLERQAKPVRTLRPDVPDDFAHVVDRCLHQQVGRRYLDGDELVAALEAIA